LEANPLFVPTQIQAPVKAAFQFFWQKSVEIVASNYSLAKVLLFSWFVLK
jgi:hypothetical protein